MLLKAKTLTSLLKSHTTKFQGMAQCNTSTRLCSPKPTATNNKTQRTKTSSFKEKRKILPRGNKNVISQ